MTDPGLAQALVAAQAEMKAVEPDAVNPHYKTKFVSLDNLIAKTRPVLNKHGLAIVQLPATNDHGLPVLRTILIHGPTGDRIMADSPLILGRNDMQGLGAAITYARRYAWAAALGIASEEDDDGNSAVPAKPKAEVPTTKAPAAKKTTLLQKKKRLDILIGELRDKGQHITTEQLYAAVAGLRKVDVDQLVLDIGAFDDEGVLRWRRLRDALTENEAALLLRRLEIKQAQVKTESPFTAPVDVPQ